MTLLRSLLVVLLAGLALVPALAQAVFEPLSIETSSGNHTFDVEVMRSQAELERGLMFRRQMAPDRGMLFDFGEAQSVSMWMKNTYLPLDMVFIAADGKVVNVKENATPMSEAIIASKGPVLGVLELNAGTAKRIGLKAGDLVKYGMFHP
jgi:uncharacterized membrane protein (UPF0127 family)